MTNEAVPNEYFGRDLEAMSAAVNYHKWIVDEFSPFLGKTVAEVGAGIGSNSPLLLARNVERLFAFEPSANMYPFLEEALAGNSAITTVNDFFSPRYASHQFDSAVYINVLEHIEDEATELANAFNSIRPGGHLLIFVPALPWLFSDFDKQVGHFRRYTKRGLKGVVISAGFSIVRARYFDIAGVLPWYLNFVVLRNTMVKGGVAVYDKLVVPVMRVVEGIIPPPAGKNLLLVARRD